MANYQDRRLRGRPHYLPSRPSSPAALTSDLKPYRTGEPLPAWFTRVADDEGAADPAYEPPPFTAADLWWMVLGKGEDNRTKTGRFSDLVEEAISGGATDVYIWSARWRAYSRLDPEAARAKGPGGVPMPSWGLE